MVGQKHKFSYLLQKGLVIGLFATVSGTIFLSPLPSLLAVLVFPLVYLIRGKKIPTVSFYCLLFFAVSLTSVLLYDPMALLSFDFYRRDGNFIISFVPLLVFPLYSMAFNIQKLFRLFLLFALTLYLGLFFVYLAGDKADFHGMFVAHNAAGGFLSILSSLAFAFFWNRKNWRNFFLVFLALLFLFASGSRGSLLGFILAIVFFLFWKSRKGFLIGLTIGAIVVVQIVILSLSYPKYQAYGIAEGNSSVRELISKEHGNVSGRTANIYIRTYDAWARGVHGFISSPILGTGFGSVNDLPFELEGPKAFKYNSQENKSYDSAHAHHTYLHILGEQGLVGFLLFLIFLKSIHKFIKQNGHNKVVQEFLWLSFFNLAIMSFTEHRFTTPSNALPFIISLSLYMMYVNYQKNNGQKNFA